MVPVCVRAFSSQIKKIKSLFLPKNGLVAWHTPGLLGGKKLRDFYFDFLKLRDRTITEKIKSL